MNNVLLITAAKDMASYWVPSSPSKDDLIYFHQNTIHAFEVLGEDCHAEPDEKVSLTHIVQTNI